METFEKKVPHFSQVGSPRPRSSRDDTNRTRETKNVTEATLPLFVTKQMQLQIKNRVYYKIIKEPADGLRRRGKI